MIYEGDPKMLDVGDGTDLTVTDGQPKMDEGLANAVYISLFTDPGYWGNAISDGAEKIGSRFGEILTRTLSNSTRLDAEEYARGALEWMVSEGVAKKITIEGYLPAPGFLGLYIKIDQPDAGVVEAKYEINWATMAVRVEAA